MSHIKGETRTEIIQTGIKQTVEAFDSGRIILVTSAVTLAELIQVKNADVYPAFTEMRGRPNFDVYNCDARVAELAGRIRGQYFQKLGEHPDGSPRGMMLGTCDALQIAAAAISGAETFITLDKTDQPQKGILAPLSIPVVEIDTYRLNVSEPTPAEGSQVGLDIW